MSRLTRAGRASIWLGLIVATVLALHPVHVDAADGPALPQGLQASNESVTLPAFELPAPDGGVVRAADLEGKVVVVRFWASW
jgi:cytochrome oxidase Cu insertion factor (SCO1/SenC/PrrC family)